MRRPRGEDGQATLMIIGFVFVLAMAVAMVVDASAAYLQRQGLDTVADGAALRGADLGASGREVYTGGVPTGRLDVTADAVRSAVHDYLAASGAYAAYPGLTFEVAVHPATSSVEVRVSAPLDLPLTVPGSPGIASIGATGSAVVVAER
ncbi:pilus assembly protein TadG-related protein [Nocardioides mangrovi]|uniref:Pilus assembly protein TadG-related protein n=1 Tax=Nocardioides mangrovi TaxID=2874580 RepID=A0ABS7U9F4_9ACTN|nr:pilus assembly protein TadG-related protein [Nocardioides mangrovi]MBZ5737497.1 pilus assembly protein TadG-related protein [Nocardioides mangrovi]